MGDFHSLQPRTHSMARIYINRDIIKGVRFGRLVVSKYENSQNVFVICDCGRSKRVSAHRLRTGHTRSCGCLRAEQLSTKNLKHGLHGTREYITWKQIRARCFNPNHAKFHMWGGRGISMCERWTLSFSDFLADMGERPDGCSIDRIDNNGDYEPSNCRWATRIEQANNTRRNVMVEHEGRRQSVSQWAHQLGIAPIIIHRRIYKGSDPHKAIFGF